MKVSSYGFSTDVGILREKNEDSFCVLPDIGLWAIADGMGGYKGGETASRMTVETLAEDIRKGANLSEAILHIHHEIVAVAETDPEKKDMGSTIVAMRTEGDEYQIAWVGDSRAYLWDGSILKQITRDHSYIQYLLDEGTIGEAEAENHPEHNAILQALGVVDLESVDVDEVFGIFHKDEKILLCSDGLTNEVSDDRIGSILSETEAPQDAVDRLINEAKINGGADNITVILVCAPEDAEPQDNADITVEMETDSTDQTGKNRLPSFWLWSIIFILSLMVVAVTVYWSRQ